MAERRAQLYLDWIEQHPERYKKVKDKLAALSLENVRAQNQMARMAPGIRQQATMQNKLGEAYRDTQMKVVKTRPEFAMLEKAFKGHVTGLEMVKKKLEGFSKKVGFAGVRLGWFSFRLLMVGRMLLRQMQLPLKKTMDMLKKWDQTMMTIGLTMGLLSYQGNLTEKMQSTLTDTMRKLPEVGLEMQAAFGLLESAFAVIAVDVGPLLSEALRDIATAVIEVWEEVGPVLIPALQELMDSVLPPLIDLIKDVGPAFVLGFVEGIGAVVGPLIWLLSNLKFLAGPLGKVIGMMVAFSPILMLVGTAGYFLSAALGGIQAAIWLVTKGLIPVATWLLTKLGLLTANTAASFSYSVSSYAAAGATGGLGAACAAAAPFLLALGVAAFGIAAAIIAVVAAIAFLTGRWSQFTGGIAKVVGALRGAGKATAEFKDETKDLGETVDDEFGHSIGDVVAKDLDKAVGAVKRARIEFAGTELSIGAPGVEGKLGGGGTKYISIPVEVTIENMSAEIDKDEFFDELTERMAEAVEKGVA